MKLTKCGSFSNYNYQKRSFPMHTAHADEKLHNSNGFIINHKNRSSYTLNILQNDNYHFTPTKTSSSSSWLTLSSNFYLLLFTVVYSVLQAPGQCYGHLLSIQYRYEYSTQLILNNNDNHEPAGFRCQGQVLVENIWQDQSYGSHLIMIQLEQFRFQPRDNVKHFTSGPEISGEHWPPVLAHISVHDGQLQSLFIEKKTEKSKHLIEPTHLNLVVSILNALRTRQPTNHNNNSTFPYRWFQQGRTLTREFHQNQESTSSRFSLFAPIIKDSWQIWSQLAEDHDISTAIHGWQNVTLESKIYPNGHSKLFVSFNLKLMAEEKSSTNSRLSKATSISQAVYLFGTSIRSGRSMVSLGAGHFHAERKPCQPHFCQSLSEFIDEYQQYLSEDKSLATNAISVAFLRLLNYIRTNSGQLTRKDLSRMLNKLDEERNKNGNLFSTLLDAIAASRHDEAILAALDHLNLPKCSVSSGEHRVSDCERFLAVMAISGSTVANMGSSHVAEHSLSVEQLLDVLVPLSTDGKWLDDRVKHSFELTIATLLHSYQLYVKTITSNDDDQMMDHQLYDSSRRQQLRHHSSPTWFVDVSADSQQQENMDGKTKPYGQDDKLKDNQKHHQQKLQQVSEKILKHFQHELETGCKDAECRVVYLHALGNARIISKHGILSTLKRYAVNKSMKRESVAAMKALRDCVHFEWHEQNLMANDKLVNRLKQLLIRILYDSTLETTSRLLAAELLANYIDPNGDVTIELVQHLDKFPSELATMIWKRAVRNVLVRRQQRQLELENTKNWHLHSKILSGSSASFRYVMGGTEHVNTSYGVFLELLKAKLPKETLFNVDISRNLSVQDVISVGLFARGLQSLAGDSADEDDDNENDIEQPEEESTLAGMTLQILGQQLRPFLFFRSTSELMGHLWSGAASEPTPVFRANLLLADYLDVKPVVNGFLVEQSLKGIFSLDLNGEVQVSLWNRNSHSNVQTNGAILFQGSQEIFTTDYKTSVRKLFSFGAESRLDFITDFDFYNSPFRICIQITQPEFIFRHNTRKYEQWYSDDLHRRIHRRSYKIPAKSYILNRDNSEMCAMMNGGHSTSATNSEGGGFDFEF